MSPSFFLSLSVSLRLHVPPTSLASSTPPNCLQRRPTFMERAPKKKVEETHSEKEREQTKDCNARRMRILLQKKKEIKKSHNQFNYHDLFYC
jgi:hypothetical protein